VPLNSNGRGQARAPAERLRGEGIVSIASSDLQRARGTAEIVAEVLDLEIGCVDPDLREQRFGRFEGLTRVECQESGSPRTGHATSPARTPPRPTGSRATRSSLASPLPSIASPSSSRHPCSSSCTAGRCGRSSPRA